MKDFLKALSISLIIYICIFICTGGVITAVSFILNAFIGKMIDGILGTKILESNNGLLPLENFLTPRGFWQSTILNLILLVTTVCLCFRLDKRKTLD